MYTDNILLTSPKPYNRG